MNQTQTGIAVALALAVVLFFFVFGGMSVFSTATPEESADVTTNIENTSTTTMPTEEIKPVTELMMKDEVLGTGATAAAGDSVTVNYVGSFIDGKVFDASASHGSTGFTFNLGAGQVIKGWDQGVAGMKEGGKRKLIIPASLGYGPNDYGPIPGNSTLVFEVELLKVVKK